MFKPADLTPPDSHRRLGAATIGLLVLVLPLAALAGITAADAPEVLKGPGTYQIRCWQQGRLLFEENHVSLPADSAKYGLKMAGADRNGKPVYVADTANATCLIRSVDHERATWPY